MDSVKGRQDKPQVLLCVSPLLPGAGKMPQLEARLSH